MSKEPAAAALDEVNVCIGEPVEHVHDLGTSPDLVPRFAESMRSFRAREHGLKGELPLQGQQHCLPARGPLTRERRAAQPYDLAPIPRRT